MNLEYDTDRLLLKIASPDYLREVLSFQLRNRDIFEKYEPTRPENFYTMAYQQSILRAEFHMAMKQTTIRFYVFRKEAPSFIIGTVCLHDVIRLAYSCCELGYKFDREYWHRGYAKEAAAKALDIAFHDLGLHRVFARVEPGNTPSLRLLEALSFFPEGVERECICINGKWTDHLRYARICSS